MSVARNVPTDLQYVLRMIRIIVWSKHFLNAREWILWALLLKLCPTSSRTEWIFHQGRITVVYYVPQCFLQIKDVLWMNAYKTNNSYFLETIAIDAKRDADQGKLWKNEKRLAEEYLLLCLLRCSFSEQQAKRRTPPGHLPSSILLVLSLNNTPRSSWDLRKK